MKTYCFLSTSRKGTGCSTLPIFIALCGFLIALQCMLPSVTFAAPAERGLALGTSLAMDKASVAVVRLGASYTAIPPNVSCTPAYTGLGVLVGSWATSSAQHDFLNWVLTDSALVNPKGLTCNAGKSTEQLSSIQVIANSTYANSSAGVPLSTLQCKHAACTNSSNPTAETIACHLTGISLCAGAVLVPFHTSTPQPYLDVAPTDSFTSSPFGIELAGSLSSQPNFNQQLQALTPDQVLPNDVTNPTNDLGLPLINSDGQLADMETKAPDTGIPAFVTSQLSPLQAGHSNTLHDNWNTGVIAFYTKTASSLSAAFTDFLNAGKPNRLFQAPAAFLKLPQFNHLAATATASAKVRRTTGGTSPATASPTSDVLLNVLLIGAAVILLIIILLVLLLLVRRQFRQRQEDARLNRIAEENAARIRQEEQAQQKAQQAIRQPSAVNSNAAKHAANPPAQPAPDLRCPNCGTPVRPTDNFCSNCRVPLVLSDSGLNVRMVIPQAQVPPSPAAQPPSFSPPQPGFMPPSSIYDEPTRQMSPSQHRNGQEDLEKSSLSTAEGMAGQAHAPVEQHFSGPNMSLVVGTRSNPGIKRQHKPNEDSLFAAQGERTLNSQAQQFGMFVVADGMGGHANGQDASRLAIQTISDTILPKLSSNEALNDDALIQLLVDGVQSANAAVHQRNMEHRADMGTTMTAALVVGTTAYVANVGDSRTYLYRQPGGLRKITNDHSVVASLVEAGIIKPDDIYTHPKRNQIYRSLGEKPVVEVDSFKVVLEPGDKLLLCSDGLWDMVRDPTIEQVLSTVPDPSQTGNALIKAALEGGGEDNVSVIVVHITEATQHTGMTGIQLLVKPEAPQWPPM